MIYGEVPKEDLAMTVYGPDTAAAAVVLGDFGNLTVEFFQSGLVRRFEHHRRVKILKRSGFDYADVAIPYIHYAGRQEFYFDRAMVHLPNGEKIKIKKRDIFIEKLDDYLSVAKITFPKIEIGCVVEYSYVLHTKWALDLPDWYFQEDVPVRRSELRVDFLRDFSYKFFFQGNEGMELISDKNGVRFFKGEHGTCRLSNGKYVMENLPALKPEPYITTMDDYRARIRFQMSEINRDTLFKSWDSLQENLLDMGSFGKQFMEEGNFEKISEAAKKEIGKPGSETEKVNALYGFLLDNIKWNGIFSVDCGGETLDEIFAEKEATSGEVNLMLLALLRQNNITAFPILTSTRSNGKMIEGVPFPSQFNHMMVVAEYGGKRLVLDATDPLRPTGYPNTEALNGRGLMVQYESGPIWVDIVPPKKNKDVLFFELSLHEDGSIDGMMRGAYQGYNAVRERRDYNIENSGNHWRKRLGDIFPELKMDSIKHHDLKDIENSFFDTLILNVPEAAQVMGDFIYLPPVLFSHFMDNPFKLKERLYPVDFPYPFMEQYILKLKLPENYSVEALPKSAHFALPDNAGGFQFSAVDKGNGQISVSSRIYINQLKYFPDEYPAIKELFDLAAEKFGEQIVLVASE